MLRPGRRDERGATAVLVALMATALLGIGAVSVDVGQVYAARASLQQGVDKAAVAAAAYLDGTTTCPSAAKEEARRILARNWSRLNANNLSTPSSISLNGSAAGGGIECTADYRVKLRAPQARIDFGLARMVSDTTGMNVPAEATAKVFSIGKGQRVMPMLSPVGCSWGEQWLFEPNNGTGTGCDSQGTRGALDLPRAAGGAVNTVLANNISQGLEYGLSIHPQAAAGSGCGAGPADRLAPTDGTNCVQTLPGNRPNAYDDGVQKLLGGANAATSPACGTRPRLAIFGGLNNDSLSCWLGGAPLASVARADYSGPRLPASVMSSPRFVWVPVTTGTPTPRSSYKIADFRPGFIQDSSATNGLVLKGNGRSITAVRVFLFSVNALPISVNAPDTWAYMGVGPKVIRLVD